MMRRTIAVAIVAYVVAGAPRPAAAQVDPQRAQEYFAEAKAVCERDGGRLWGVSICAPMVIGDAHTHTIATSQPPPDAPRPPLIGLLNGPIQWGDTMWAALTWDTIANWPPRTRGEAFAHESFHIVQQRLGLGVGLSANEQLDTLDGRYWLRLEWRALARALRESGRRRADAVRDALAFRRARQARFPGAADNERALEINEGLASYTQTVLAAPSPAGAVARGLELLAGAEDADSFVRTFAYTSGPAYGLLRTSTPIACRGRGARSRPTPACSKHRMAGRGACRRRCGPRARRFPTAGRSRPRRGGWSATARAAATTSSRRSSPDGAPAIGPISRGRS
jgi:hypothetical protein